MGMSSGQSGFKLAYEIAPISLNGGIASGMPGGILGVFNLIGRLFEGSSLDEAFANFFPISGSTLIEQQIGNYPFANSQVAANCTIAQPLVVSLLMRVPVNRPNGYAIKTMIMTSLQATLKQHNQAGGTYSVATPSFFYENVILTKLHDVSGGETQQAQYQYQWDFVKPLIMLDDANAAQNALMSQLSSGGYTDGTPSSLSTSIGQGTSGAAAIDGTPTIGTGVGTPVGSGGIGFA